MSRMLTDLHSDRGYLATDYTHLTANTTDTKGKRTKRRETSNCPLNTNWRNEKRTDEKLRLKCNGDLSVCDNDAAQPPLRARLVFYMETHGKSILPVSF